jgi:hypothetical protein
MIFAMRLYIVLAAICMAVYLSACNGPYGAPMNPPATPVDTVTITWVRQSPKVCAGKPETDGCFVKSGNDCAVVMAWDAPDSVVSHEIKHCYGWTHND